jgi:site-specific DNA-methyltransferase (adenine-specific)
MRVAWQHREHPTQKPASILTTMIESLTRPGELVLDPFVGSGSTAVAARASGRRFIGIELDGGHVETARRRVAECRFRGGASRRPSSMLAA